jgi:hypothetical protein
VYTSATPVEVQNDFRFMSRMPPSCFAFVLDGFPMISSFVLVPLDDELVPPHAATIVPTSTSEAADANTTNTQCFIATTFFRRFGRSLRGSHTQQSVQAPIATAVKYRPL